MNLHQIPVSTTSATISNQPNSNLKQIHRGVLFAALAACAALLFSATAHASSILAPGEMGSATAAPPAAGEKYELKLHHLHTGEDLDIVYRVGNTYIPAAIDKLNHFLRDSRTADQSHYDPKEFDLLHNLLTRLNKPAAVIQVVCGYRTPWSNNFLRTRGGTATPAQTGVALNSQHIQAKAIDIKVPGIATRKLRDIALSLQAGGVGYYPVSQFVHVDVGPVRKWTFAGRGDN